MVKATGKKVSFPDLCRKCRGCGSNYISQQGTYCSWNGEDRPRAGVLFRDAVADRETVVLDPPSPGRGERIGNYTTTRLLGSGGMADVWKAWDHRIGRWVALKIRRDDSEMSPSFLDREARIAGRLSHPRIVPVYENGNVGGRRFIAMQLIRGRTLARIPGDDVARIVSLVRDVAETVHYAHERGVIHCDVKPSNLMVEEGAQGDRVYLLDFGVAKRGSRKRSNGRENTVVGSSPYISPEMVRKGSGRVDSRTDIYSLGVTLFEILGGRLPDRGSLEEQYRQKTSGEWPASLRERNSGVDARLERIIFKCLSPDPGGRYASADGLARALGDWLAGNDDPKTPSRRRGRWATLFSAGTLALGIGVGVLGTALFVS